MHKDTSFMVVILADNFSKSFSFQNSRATKVTVTAVGTAWDGGTRDKRPYGDVPSTWVAKSASHLHLANTVLSLINAPGALQFFKRGMFIRGKFSMQKCSV